MGRDHVRFTRGLPSNFVVARILKAVPIGDARQKTWYCMIQASGKIGPMRELLARLNLWRVFVRLSGKSKGAFGR